MLREREPWLFSLLFHRQPSRTLKTTQKGNEKVNLLFSLFTGKVVFFFLGGRRSSFSSFRRTSLLNSSDRAQGLKVRNKF